MHAAGDGCILGASVDIVRSGGCGARRGGYVAEEALYLIQTQLHVGCGGQGVWV